jgi:superfamily II DNA/RNA helicase
VPTRELAVQIQDNLALYTKYSKISWTTLIGGESLITQEKSLEKDNDIIIATPGRFLDVKQRGKILLTNVKVVVIDEADRMLDMGFLPDIDAILSFLPANRQTLLFSATLPEEIKQLTKKYLRDCKEISITPEFSAAQGIDQHFFLVSLVKKDHALKDIIRQHSVPTIVFCNRKKDIESLKVFLNSFHIKQEVLHGDMTQANRSQALDRFKKGEVSLLIASDVVARGIDVDNLGLVINYDVPIQAEDYIHRIGRTGRAGKAGKAITLFTPKDKKLVPSLEKILQHSINIVKIKEEEGKEEKKTIKEKKENPSLKRKNQEGKVVREIAETPTDSIKSSPKQKRAKNLASYEEEDSFKVVGFGNYTPTFMFLNPREKKSSGTKTSSNSKIKKN